MTTKKNILSAARLNRLHAQGYTSESNVKLTEMAFGIRFAYRSCVVVLIIAMATKSLAVFSFMLGIALLGIVLPNHPFDYVYNIVLSNWMNKPQLPARSRQLKFACLITTIWLAAIIYLMSINNITAGLIMSAILVGIALLPSTIDLCIPSLIYNVLFGKKVKHQPFN